MKNSGLKKHHFWILLGAVPLFVGLLLLLILTGPVAAISEQETKYKASASAASNAKAMGVGMLTELATQKGILEERRGQLWSVNYDRQKKAGVFVWPNPNADPARGDRDLKALENLDLRFGAQKVDLVDPAKEADAQYLILNDEMKKFTEIYFDSYAALAKTVGPTRFEGAGGWQSVLRYVTDWGTSARPESNAFWLALEDFWIQRALLKPIAEVNEGAKKFEIVKPAAGTADTPLKRKFRSRTWEIDLELTPDRVLKSTLKNRTDRLQMLGLNKSMRLKVWLDDPKLSTSQAFEYRIGGELVKGSGELIPKVVPEIHRIPAGAGAAEIYKVEQILDEITVPVRLIRKIELGYRDAKRNAAELKQPSFFPEEAPPADPAGGGPPGGMGGPPGGVGGPPAGMGGPPGGGRGGPIGMSPGGPGGEGGSAIGGAKTGTAEQVLLGNKKRYIERTEQVRRMPVGLDLVVDQAYVNDVLIAFGNSPLRFQVTQTQWQRFRDPLAATGSPESDPGTGGVAPMFPMPGVSPPGVGSSGAAGGALPTSQVTAGLVELAVYGIVSIYEKVKVKPAEAGKTSELKTDPKPEIKPDVPPNPGVPQTVPPK